VNNAMSITTEGVIVYIKLLYYSIIRTSIDHGYKPKFQIKSNSKCIAYAKKFVWVIDGQTKFGPEM